jgi:hypothetical protein
MAKELFTITRRPGWGAELMVEIECDPAAVQPLKLGLAVRVAYATGANLDGARLDGANLVGANLVGANLVGANLDGANLVGANLYGANLDGANLDGANLDGARLDGARLDGAKLDGARIKRLLASIGRGDGYVFYAFELQAGGVKIKAGCRWFTLAEFRDHVAAAYPDTDKAVETLWILDAIERRVIDLNVEI